MNRTSNLTIVFSGLILIGAISLLLVKNTFKQEANFHGKVEDILPKPGEIPGWQVEYAPIADTPEIKAKVDELLNYDQGIYALYRLRDIRISIYLAYWMPGKMAVRGIARHTPDVCWVESGWKRVQRDELTDLVSGHLRLGRTEHGIYGINGVTEHVAFWHIAGGEIISYRTQARPPWHAAITEFIRWGNAYKQEQFFLRISSNRPLDEFLQAKVVSTVLEKVPGVLVKSN